MFEKMDDSHGKGPHFCADAILCGELLIKVTLVLSLGAARAGDGPAVTPLEANGVVADVQELFPRTVKLGKKVEWSGAQMTLKEVAARALITQDSIYAFLQTPDNRRFLKEVKPGTAVTVEGRLLTSGSLLPIDSLVKAKGDFKIDLERYEDEEGKEVTLQGTNKCQCGLSVAELPHSCALGHLHHLEANDGKIYQRADNRLEVGRFLA